MNIIHRMTWRTIRYQNTLRKAVKAAFWTSVGIVVLVSSFYATRLYLWAVNESQAEVAKVTADNAELLLVLHGKKAMAEHDGKYVVLTSVTYEEKQP